MVVLRQGSHGSPVKYLQIRLNARLYPSPKLNIDGHFGPKTRAAVERFQTANHVDVDGVVGPTSWTALAVLSRGTPIPPLVRKFAEELGTVDDFVNYLKTVEKGKSSVAEVMKSLWGFFDTPGRRRYVIVRRGGPGVIDFRHFFTAASESYVASGKAPIGGTRGDTVVLGLLNELGQCVDELSKRQINSCFAREDLGSNRLGADFGRFVKARVAENSRKPVSEMFRDYLAQFGPETASSVSRVKMPGGGAVSLEALAAILLGVYDAMIPDAY